MTVESMEPTENREQVTIRNEEPEPQLSLAPVPRHTIEVTIIKPGPARVKIGETQVSYSEEALKQSLPLWEGAACFCDHSDKSVRNIAGVYFSPWWDDGVKARLRFIDDNLYHLVEQMVNDRQQGLPVPDIGISADIGIDGIPIDNIFEVREITSVFSADIVFSPAAGGSFDRVLNSVREKYGIPQPQNQTDSDSSPVRRGESGEELVPVKRVRDLQSANDKLRAQVKNQQELISEKEQLLARLQTDLEAAAATYREHLLAQHPEMPAELVEGNSIDEVNESFLKAQKVVETVRRQLEEDIPAGAPARSGVDVAAMSSREKIEYGVKHGRARR